MPISLPKFFQRAFAQNGGKQDVPITGDTSGGRASYDAGFPPVTRIPIVAGGIPPFGTDFNGVLYDLSQAIQYVQSGVAFPFNQDFATAIGGYEIGAIVSDASDKSLLWINGTTSNTAFPTGWTSFQHSDPTETARGMPLVATQAETIAGNDDEKMVTPKKLRAGFAIVKSGNLLGVAFPSWLGGFIINAGKTTVPANDAPVTVSLPIAYTTQHTAAVASVNYGASVVGMMGAIVSSNSLTTVTVMADSSDQALGATSISWISIGY